MKGIANKHWWYFAIVGVAWTGVLDLNFHGFLDFPRAVSFLFLAGNFIVTGIKMEKHFRGLE